MDLSLCAAKQLEKSNAPQLKLKKKTSDSSTSRPIRTLGSQELSSTDNNSSNNFKKIPLYMLNTASSSMKTQQNSKRNDTSYCSVKGPNALLTATKPVQSPPANRLVNQLRELNLKKIGSSSNPASLSNRTAVKHRKPNPDSSCYLGTNNKENNFTTANLHKKTSSEVTANNVKKQNTIKTNKQLVKVLKESAASNKRDSNGTQQSSSSFNKTASFNSTFKPPVIKQHFSKLVIHERLPASSIKTAQPSIEQFKIGRRLGKGRFGNVYLAEDKKTGMQIAVKIINKKQLVESGMESQLIEQIKVQMYMQHPNILQMYGFIVDQTNIYMLLELGMDCLFKQLRQKTLFSEQMTAFYIRQVLEGLKYMHSEHIIHRDIKPQNILINEGVLKISDFGWSTYAPMHKRQTFCGTLDYVPPQIVEGEHYDQKVDIWSLGVLCYELATGKAPFEVGNDKQRTYKKILQVQLSFPSHLSPELCDLISKILTRNPTQRLTLSEIQRHPWLVKHATFGRHITKQIWEAWRNLN